MRLSKFSIGFVLCIVLTCLCSGAEAKKKKKKVVDPGKPPDDSIEVIVNLDVPVTKEGAGFVGGLKLHYRPTRFLNLTFSANMASDPQEQVAPGNLVFGFLAGYCYDKKGWGYCIGLDMDMGISPAELDRDKAWAMDLGLYDKMSLAPFMRNSLVLAPRLIFKLIPGGLGISTYVGPEMGLPLYQEETHDGLPYRGSIAYGIKLGTGAGDLRGGFGFDIGFVGLSDWTGEEEHTYCLDAGIGMRFTRPYIDLSLDVRIPVGGPSARIQAAVLMMVSWHHYPEED